MQKSKISVRLTPRQQEILFLSSEGKTYEQIAQKLGISYCTVRAHLVAVREKFNVTSTINATLAAKRLF